MENIYPEIIKGKPDEELLAMVYNDRQWEEGMLMEAEAELERRGILPDDIRSRKNAIIENEAAILSEGRQAEMAGQILGWIGIFGILGIIIGYHHTFAKVLSKYTGKEYFKYNEQSRENGRYTFYIAVILHSLWFFNKFMIFLRDRV